MRSRWLVPAALFATALSLSSLPLWPSELSKTPGTVLSAVSINCVWAFSLAVLFEAGQWSRARFPTLRRPWSAALTLIASAYAWVVSSELVLSVSGLATLGYRQVIALTLAAACVLALHSLRARGLGGRGLTLLSNFALVALLFWVQTRYRMQLREAKYASVSAAFLLLTSVAFLRLVERLRAAIATNALGFCVLLGALGVSLVGYAHGSERPLRQLYFAGLFPGRFLYALHLPELLQRRARRTARLESEIAAAQEPPEELRVGTGVVEAHSDDAEVLVIALVDALRADEWLTYLHTPGVALSAFAGQNCFAGTFYSPSSNTASSLTTMFQRPGGHGALWIESARRTGVKTSLVTDRTFLEYLEPRLPQVRHFERRAGLPRDANGHFARLTPTVGAWLQEPGRHLIWAHYFEVHEWTEGHPGAARSEYVRRVTKAGEQLAELLATVAATKRPATVVLMSDHGEGVDHFSTRTHGEFAYEALVRTPVVLWAFNHACGSNLGALSGHRPSTSILGRLFLDELGVPSPAPLPTLRELGQAPVLIQASMQDAYIRWPYKFIASPWFVELYDLAADPHEQNDLSDVQPALVRELRADLERAAGAH
jgi:hypothetical protein